MPPRLFLKSRLDEMDADPFGLTARMEDARTALADASDSGDLPDRAAIRFDRRSARQEERAERREDRDEGPDFDGEGLAGIKTRLEDALAKLAELDMSELEARIEEAQEKYDAALDAGDVPEGVAARVEARAEALEDVDIDAATDKIEEALEKLEDVDPEEVEERLAEARETIKETIEAGEADGSELRARYEEALEAGDIPEGLATRVEQVAEKLEDAPRDGSQLLEALESVDQEELEAKIADAQAKYEDAVDAGDVPDAVIDRVDARSERLEDMEFDFDTAIEKLENFDRDAAEASVRAAIEDGEIGFDGGRVEKIRDALAEFRDSVAPEDDTTTANDMDTVL